MNCVDACNVTTFEDLQKYSGGTIVKFPDFAEGMPFVARVKRPSLLVLAKTGKIPNSLLTAATSLFMGKGDASADDKMLADMYDVCKVIAEATLIEPSFKDIEMAGIDLTDEQIMSIFNYTQTGVKALESFRKEQANS